MNECSRCPYWVTPKVGGCRLPCPEDLDRLAAEGVVALVSLVEDYELTECWSSADEYVRESASRGLNVVRLPVEDGAAPDPDDACRLFRALKALEDGGGKVVFHCYAGMGRTGTLLAAYLAVTRCMDPYQALSLVRKANPCAGPETEEQALFLEYIRASCDCIR
ncbi:MAG: dual specificity protein phosphatase family protein [Thermoproteota archaeon]